MPNESKDIKTTHILHKYIPAFPAFRTQNSLPFHFPLDFFSEALRQKCQQAFKFTLCKIYTYQN